MNSISVIVAFFPIDNDKCIQHASIYYDIIRLPTTNTTNTISADTYDTPLSHNAHSYDLCWSDDYNLNHYGTLSTCQYDEFDNCGEGFLSVQPELLVNNGTYFNIESLGPYKFIGSNWDCYDSKIESSYGINSSNLITLSQNESIKDEITIYYQNVRGLRSKTTKLTCALQTTDYDI
uniref:Uncharacterized protein n=1 Tax=Cacopsylla melanoneura TaxID=428564 RepID=A0A8D8Z959_9HEMI